MKETDVFIQQTEEMVYSKDSPFHPDIFYPESPFNILSNQKNSVYNSFRELLFLMELDKENWNSKEWNPFSFFI